MLCYVILFVYNVILDDKEFEKDIRYLFPVHLYGSIMMKTEGRNTLCYRKCLIYPFDIFNQGPGRSVGADAEGNKEGRRRYRGQRAPGNLGQGAGMGQKDSRMIGYSRAAKGWALLNTRRRAEVSETI